MKKFNRSNLILIEELEKIEDEYGYGVEFRSNYLSNIDALKWLHKLIDMGAKVFVEEDTDDRCEVWIDVNGVNKRNLIEIFLFITQSKPDEFTEVDRNFLRIWWD
jgi:hypothetical protein